jgi:LysM repeat protein
MKLRFPPMLALLVLALAVAPRVRAEDTVGWHVVKEGETLSRITARYLGSSALWRENWRLNPGVPDPNKLQPGQRLRVILSRTIPAQSALLTRVSRRVEKKPEPKPWTAAHAGDQLVERNGIRTHEASSAELRFEDDTRLTLTERSLIFLRSPRASARAQRASEIEIVDGHADLDTPLRKSKGDEIEIVVGTTSAKPAAAASKARFRKEGTSAQVMSYRGAARVSSAGASVSVTEGLGVAVPEGKKPPKPEKLLAAPAVPEVDFVGDRPRLRWPAVANASSYSVEICRDSNCAELVTRAASVRATEWQPAEPVPAGTYVWRVSAKSASGLDGFAGSAALRLREAVAEVRIAEDGGPGSLRSAIEAGNAAGVPHTIRLLSSETIRLTSPLPRITVPTVIAGTSGEAEMGSVTVVGAGRTMLRNPSRSNVTIDFNGAAIGIDAAQPLTLRDVTLTGAATHVRSGAALVLENVVVGTLLARRDANGIEIHGPAELRRVLVTGMLGTAVRVAAGAALRAEHLEISDSGVGLMLQASGSRIRDSLFLLNETGAVVTDAKDVDASTFRGNRTAVILPALLPDESTNTFDENVLTMAVAQHVSSVRVDDAGRTVVSGTAKPGATVEIHRETAPPIRAVANADGSFEITLP